MRYEEAIDWLAKKAAEGEKAALNKEGEVHIFGMDIEEAPERYMVDTIGEPIILTHFPRPIKAFYMQPDATDPRVTESCDILIPGVGEIVGASMRYFLLACRLIVVFGIMIRCLRRLMFMVFRKIRITGSRINESMVVVSTVDTDWVWNDSSPG
jgi:tRNA synthetases class II (D, K and N)